MADMLIRNVRIYGEGEKRNIYVKNGKIAKITVGDTSEKSGFDGICVRDFHGMAIFPGLVDIHSHGCIGLDTMDGPEAVAKMSVYQKRNGITTWYPTTMTESRERIHHATDILPKSIGGCHIPGYHMEGPFISEKHKGAQNGEFIRKPNTEEFSEYKNVSLITMAPETEGAMKFIEELKNREKKEQEGKCGADGRGSDHTVICIGHTDADFECANRAFAAGCECITHTFNAMPPFLHREPSVIGAGIVNNAYAQLICDGFHVSLPAVIMLYRTFGAKRLILISDSLRATGMSDGEYEFGGQRVTVKDGAARLPDGTIAGSTTNLFGCVRTAIKFGIPKRDAFRMASETPSRLMGLNKGVIEEGYDADFVIVDDKCDLVETVICD